MQSILLESQRKYPIKVLLEAFALDQTLVPDKENEVTVPLVGDFPELVDTNIREGSSFLKRESGLFTDRYGGLNRCHRIPQFCPHIEETIVKIEMLMKTG